MRYSTSVGLCLISLKRSTSDVLYGIRRGLTLLQNSSDKVKICKSLRDCARRRNRKEEDFVAEVASKSYLSPKLLLNNKAFIMLSSFKANFLGIQKTVDAFPWMHQYKDFSMCGHVAIWSILKFMGNKHTTYKDINIGQVVDSVPEQVNRKLPSHGLSLYQMAEIFKHSGITPLIVEKEKGREEEFYRELFCYIESGIPIVAAMNSKNHSIAVIGHGELNLDLLDGMHGFVDSFNLITSLIGNDDNSLP